MSEIPVKNAEIAPARARPEEPRMEIRTGVSKAVPQVGQPELKRKKLAIIPVRSSWFEMTCLRKFKIKKRRPMRTDCTRLRLVR